LKIDYKKNQLVEQDQMKKNVIFKKVGEYSEVVFQIQQMEKSATMKKKNASKPNSTPQQEQLIKEADVPYIFFKPLL